MRFPQTNLKTTHLLTIISISELFWCSNMLFSLFLWGMYGVYKMAIDD